MRYSNYKILLILLFINPYLCCMIPSYENLVNIARSKTPDNTGFVQKKAINIEFEECRNALEPEIVAYVLKQSLLFFIDSSEWDFFLMSKTTVDSQLLFFDGHYTCMSFKDIRLSVRYWLPTRSLGIKASIRIRFPKEMIVETLPILDYFRQEFRPVTFVCTD